ncbi:8-amino-7-oxononanoate synthase [Brucella sp. NBRC 12953]
MSFPAFDRYQTRLTGLMRRSRFRVLSQTRGVDFTSNDYLGLARAPQIAAAIAAAIDQEIPQGAAGSRLLRGNHPVHEALEAEAASFFGAQTALYFSNGFAANVALFSTLPQSDDLILYDALIHASVHDGIRGSRARAVAVPHNNVEAVEQAIRFWREGGGRGAPWIAVESLYSMDGDRAPLAELLELAIRHEGFLVVDEAHATGVLGPEGRGLASTLKGAAHLITLHGCGKALGVSGALLCLPATLAGYLVNHARSFIYSTAPSPLIAEGVRAALRVVSDEPERRDRLNTLCRHAGDALASTLAITPSYSQIQPVLIGDNARALRIAGLLQEEGFDIRAIRPPTVAIGTARLRISITLNVDEAQITAMIERLGSIVKEVTP